MQKTQLEALVARHEGFSEHIYRCTAGKLTIGYGLNLQAGLPEDEAHMLLRMRLDKCAAALQRRLPWFAAWPDDPRRDVLIDMAYQLGVDGLLAFRRFLAACQKKDWPAAAKEMLDSKWAREDSPNRAKELAGMMRG